MTSKTMSYFLFIFTAIASFLFFTVQLASSKIVTPIFGGIAWVWVLTMLFYQAVLLIGYYIAGRLSDKKTKNVLMILGVFMILSAVIVPKPLHWGNIVNTFGMVQVIYILFMAVGLPGITLASSTIILQKAAHSADISPWQLYFYSNIGSLSAIVLYPFVIETLLPGSIFIMVWKIVLILLGAAIIVVSLKVNKEYVFKGEGNSEQRPDLISIGIWLLFSAVPSAFLAVISVFLNEDIASMPFLWAFPLGMFMLAFALPFAPKIISTYKNSIHFTLSSALLYFLINIFFKTGKMNILFSITISLLAVFYITWIYASVLVNNKPEAEFLHYFYVSLAVGGFLGNLFVSVVSPHIFDTYVERWIITIVVLLLPIMTAVFKNQKTWVFRRSRLFIAQIIIVVLFFGFFGGYVYTHKFKYIRKGGYEIEKIRSMYGSIRVTDGPGSIDMARYMYNGNVMHGSQHIVNDVLYTEKMSSYYDDDISPLKFLYEKIQKRSEAEGKQQQVAVIGLGAGALNFYSYPGIHSTFFEIDKNSELMAKKHFSYLSMKDRDYSIEIGDGRLLLSKKPANEYAMIIMDAFNGVSVPRHLLTIEAMDLYLDKLNDDGIIVVHCSNMYLNINEVVNLTINSKGIYCYIGKGKRKNWVIASKKPIENAQDYLELYGLVEEMKDKTWTDDYTPVIPFIKK